MSEKQEMKLKMQRLHFALVDLSLFLDSHQDIEEAFSLFQKYGKEYLATRKAYVEKYGPLTHNDMINMDKWHWVHTPWPWEREE